MARPYESLRVFDNPVLEWLTHVHPVMPLLIWGPVISWLLWRSFAVHGLSAAAVSAFAVAGLLIWSLTEYLLHRYLFHIKAESPFRVRVQFIIHGVHHNDPVDPTRLVMPPVPACIGGALFFIVFNGLLGPRWAEPLFAFFGVGYLLYDYIHYSLHRFVPRTRAGRTLHRNHMLHHYAIPEARWGVSSPLWDHIFKTTGN